MKSAFLRLSLLAVAALPGCARPVLVWDGIYFPSWLVAIVLAVPPAILLGQPVQRRLLPRHRWTREPLEIAMFAIFYVLAYFLLVLPAASAP